MDAAATVSVASGGVESYVEIKGQEVGVDGCTCSRCGLGVADPQELIDTYLCIFPYCRSQVDKRSIVRLSLRLGALLGLNDRLQKVRRNGKYNDGK